MLKFTSSTRIRKKVGEKKKGKRRKKRRREIKKRKEAKKIKMTERGKKRKSVYIRKRFESKGKSNKSLEINIKCAFSRFSI